MNWNIYLSGEIHTDWRQQIIDGAQQNSLPVSFSSAVTNHAASDAAGDVLGKETTDFWRDHKSAKINAIRTRTQIEKCDIAIIRFGDQYKQWNAAFDAGYCAAMGKPYITLHDEGIRQAITVDVQATLDERSMSALNPDSVALGA